MKKLPQSMIQPRHAILRGELGNVALEVLLVPFYWKNEWVDTAIRLDDINLPSAHLADLAGKTFLFPLNPDAEAIDGSIYLDSAHHPCDVSVIEFVRSRNDGLKVLIKGVYVFEFEGLDQFDNTPFILSTTVSSCAV